MNPLLFDPADLPFVNPPEDRAEDQIEHPTPKGGGCLGKRVPRHWFRCESCGHRLLRGWHNLKPCTKCTGKMKPDDRNRMGADDEEN